MKEDILGIGVSAINMTMAVATIAGWIERAERQYVCLTDVNGVMQSHRDAQVRNAYNGAGLATPDGMPLVWILRHAGHRHVSRVYGPDLMLALFDEGQSRGFKHFLYGTTPATLTLLRERLLRRYPDALVVGSLAPPFRPLSEDERGDVVAHINASAADIVWVGLGAPKQELWMHEHRSQCVASALIGVGAAFDIHAGRIRQAPPIVQRAGAEWLYRTVREPRRLTGRYLRNNPAFVALMAKQLLMRRLWNGIAPSDPVD